MANFPTTAPSFETADSSEVLNVLGNGTGLAGLINNVNNEVVAIAAKVGTGSTTPSNNAVLVGDGSGTSTWSTTLSGLTLSAPTITNPTITVDTISEYSSDNGVDIDSLNIKNGKLNTYN